MNNTSMQNERSQTAALEQSEEGKMICFLLKYMYNLFKREIVKCAGFPLECLRFPWFV